MSSVTLRDCNRLADTSAGRLRHRRPPAAVVRHGELESAFRRAPLRASPRIAHVFISQAFAQAAPAATGDTHSSLLSLLPLVLMFVVLYFIMIRPQMKRQKEHKAMVEALAKGDEIVTAGGVLGRVSKLGDTFLSIEVANGVELQVQRTSVVQVLPKGTLK
jgi:preprotein translocase subunit YajC